MKQLEFFIPGEPKAKQRPQFNSLTKHGFTPTQTLNYETYVKMWIYDKWDKQGIIKWDEHEPLFMFCTSLHTLSRAKTKKWEKCGGLLYPTVKPDFDNVVKIIADAMNKVVFPDDAQIIGGLPFKKYQTPGEVPGVKVKIQSVYTLPPSLYEHIL